MNEEYEAIEQSEFIEQSNQPMEPVYVPVQDEHPTATAQPAGDVEANYHIGEAGAIAFCSLYTKTGVQVNVTARSTASTRDVERAIDLLVHGVRYAMSTYGWVAARPGGYNGQSSPTSAPAAPATQARPANAAPAAPAGNDVKRAIMVNTIKLVSKSDGKKLFVVNDTGEKGSGYVGMRHVLEQAINIDGWQEKVNYDVSGPQFDVIRFCVIGKNGYPVAFSPNP